MGRVRNQTTHFYHVHLDGTNLIIDLLTDVIVHVTSIDFRMSSQ